MDNVRTIGGGDPGFDETSRQAMRAHLEEAFERGQYITVIYTADEGTGVVYRDKTARRGATTLNADCHDCSLYRHAHLRMMGGAEEVP